MKPSSADQQQLEDALDEVLRLQAAVDAAPDSSEAMMALIVGMARVDYIMEGIVLGTGHALPKMH
jgi:hypothetical protein